MNIINDFPMRRFISLDWREDRRERLRSQFQRVGFDAEWFHAIHPGHLGTDTRGFLHAAKRAVALSKRAVLREAARSKVEAVLILEDDVVFHRSFNRITDQIQLPADWGIFYFGCQHIETPDYFSRGLVRVNRALDAHAWAVRRPYFRMVSAAMRGTAKGSKGLLCSDVMLSSLHRRIPTYAAWPNLAWQAEDHSDVAERCYTNYEADGTQRVSTHIVRAFAAIQAANHTDRAAKPQTVTP